MLYETLQGPTILLWLSFAGFFSGVIFDINFFLYMLCNKNKIARIILDIVCTIAVFFVFYLCVLWLCYGEIRVYQFLVFFSACCLERATVGKLVAKVIFLCYNFCSKILKSIFGFLKKFTGKRNDKNIC